MTTLGFECSFGHQLHDGNTGFTLHGDRFCLQCLANAHQAADATTGHLVLVLLNLTSFPSREEVGA